MAFNPEDSQARYLIKFVRSDKALSFPNASKAPGTPLVQSPINRNVNQQWRLVDRYNGTFSIISVNSGLVLTANPYEQGATVVQSQDSGDPGQQWRIHPIDRDEQYVITSVLTSLDLVAAGMGDGASIITAPQPPIFPPVSAWQIWLV